MSGSAPIPVSHAPSPDPTQVSLREYLNLVTKVELLQVKVDGLTATMNKVSDSLEGVEKALNEARGGWKTIAALVSLSGTIGGLLSKFLF